MIIYGTKATPLTTQPISEQCAYCNSANTLQMHLFQRYAHVFWIPLFPIGKTGVSQCSHCKQILKLKEMPFALRLSYENMKSQTTTPFWVFSGSAVIAVIFVLSFFAK